MSRRRAGNNRLDAPMEQVKAESFDDVNAFQAASGEASGFFLFGSSPVPSWAQAVTFFVMESLLVGARGAIVALVAWLAYPSGSNATTFEWAVAIAAASAGTLYVATRTRQDSHFKRYINPIYAVAALFTRGTGLVGLLVYIVAHVLGSLFGGAVLVRSLVGASLGITPPVYPRAYFPIPTTAGTTLVTTVLLELFVPAFLVLVQLVHQHIGTPSTQDMKNYRASMKHTAIWVFGVTLIGVFYQSWLYDPSLYLTAAFAGINPAVAQPGSPPASPISPLQPQYLDITYMTNLYSTIGTGTNINMYTNSVFGTAGSAAALYTLGSLAGALIGSVVFYAFWMMYFGRGDDDNSSYRDRIRGGGKKNTLDIQSGNQKGLMDDVEDASGKLD